MIAAVMQPTFLPWLGYFKLINSVDIFVFLNDVQFNKRSWQQRNKILFNNNIHYLTVPILSKGKFSQNINEVYIDKATKWRDKHIKTIELSYKRKKHFSEIFKILVDVYNQDDDYLSSLNVRFIKSILNYLHIDTKIIFSSDLKSNGKKDEKIISILKEINIKKYLSPIGSKTYIGNGQKFINNKIDLKYLDFIHPVYSQDKNNKFIENLSIIDALFNIGKSVKNLIN